MALLGYIQFYFYYFKEGIAMRNETNNKTKHQNNNAKKGFASMDEEKQREIASKGGKAAHEKGTAHEYNSEEAREAGSKGGKATNERGKSHEDTSHEDEDREPDKKKSSSNEKHHQRAHQKTDDSE